MYADREAAWQKEIGQDYTILKDRRGGPATPLTLLELKARAEAGESFKEWRSTCNCMGYAEQTTFLAAEDDPTMCDLEKRP